MHCTDAYEKKKTKQNKTTQPLINEKLSYFSYFSIECQYLGHKVNVNINEAGFLIQKHGSAKISLTLIFGF